MCFLFFQLLEDFITEYFDQNPISQVNYKVLLNTGLNFISLSVLIYYFSIPIF